MEDSHTQHTLCESAFNMSIIKNALILQFTRIFCHFYWHLHRLLYFIFLRVAWEVNRYQLRLTNQRRPRRFTLHACARFVLFALTFAESTTFEHLSWIFRPDLVCWSVYTSKNEIVRVVDGCPRRHGVL